MWVLACFFPFPFIFSSFITDRYNIFLRPATHAFLFATHQTEREAPTTIFPSLDVVLALFVGRGARCAPFVAMSTRLDTSPEARLRRLAQSLSIEGVEIGETDVKVALQKARGNEQAAERLLREAAGTLHAQRSRVMRSSQLTREERIAKACNSLAPHVEAVDILCTSLAKVVKEPHKERFRKVNVQAAGPFKDKVASCPGGVELLYSVGFEPMHGHLVLQSLQPSLLEHALACLDNARKSEAYVIAKEHRQTAIAAAAARAEAQLAAEMARAHFLAKVPPEPAPENGGSSSSTCVVTFTIGGERIARRKFESDNTLGDLLNYVCSLPEVPVGASIKLENVTTAPFRHLDPSDKRCAAASLYALDLWPVGTVGVQLVGAKA